MNIDTLSLEAIARIERQTGKPTGMGKILRGDCPFCPASPVRCMFCNFGHMTECHYPQTCEEANCSHYQEEFRREGDEL